MKLALTKKDELEKAVSELFTEQYNSKTLKLKQPCYALLAPIILL